MKFLKILSGIITAAMAVTLVTASFATVTAQEEKKLIALTFDDGPNTTTTNEVLDVLEKYDAVGSFFLIGTNINDESAVSVKRAYEMGCEIDNHSKSHGNMSGMSAEDIEAEISYVDEKVYEITGEYPKFFRPPFIDTSDLMYEIIDLPFICGLDCKDYMENVTAQQRADTILNNAKDGLIVLLHDAAGNKQTVEALEIVMPQLIEQGYEFVTLTQLFERQGETPQGNLLYSQVAKYPCNNYNVYQNVFTGEAVGDSSWSGWGSTAVLDGEVLKSLGDDYAIEVECSSSSGPVIALQRWSAMPSVWTTVSPFYFNGSKAVFMAEDIKAALDSVEVDYTDLDKISVTAHGDEMTMTKCDILVKSTSSETVSGDIDKDGNVDVADVILIKKFLLRQENKIDDMADLNDDNKVDIFDMIILKNLILSL